MIFTKLASFLTGWVLWVQEENTRNKNLPEKFSVQIETVHLEIKDYLKCTHKIHLLF